MYDNISGRIAGRTDLPTDSHHNGVVVPFFVDLAVIAGSTIGGTAAVWFTAFAAGSSAGMNISSPEPTLQLMAKADVLIRGGSWRLPDNYYRTSPS